VFGIRAEASFLEVDLGRGHVHGFVDGGGLLDGGGDHRDRHLGEERDDGQHVRPPPVPHISYERG
jgi:hypothetical protein